MTFNKRRKKKKDLFSSKILLIVGILIAVLVANAAFKMYSKANDTKRYLNAVKNDFMNLEDQYSQVNDNLLFLQSNTGIEKEIRSKFDLAKEGERAIFIIEEDLPEIQTPQNKSFWKRVIDWASF